MDLYRHQHRAAKILSVGGRRAVPVNLEVGIWRFALGVILALLPLTAKADRPLGVDVSSYQGGSVNWVSAKNSGIAFAWAKATEGLTVNDGDFTVNEANAKSAGVLIGAYHFAHPEL